MIRTHRKSLGTLCCSVFIHIYIFVWSILLNLVYIWTNWRGVVQRPFHTGDHKKPSAVVLSNIVKAFFSYASSSRLYPCEWVSCSFKVAYLRGLRACCISSARSSNSNVVLPGWNFWDFHSSPCHKVTTVAPNQYNMITVAQSNLEQLMQCMQITQQTNKHNTGIKHVKKQRSSNC